MYQLYFKLGFTIAGILLAMLVGTLLERRHFASIRQREQAFRKLPVLGSKQYPQDRPVLYSRLCQGSVVVSIDYFKMLLAGLRMIFGGELSSFSSLLDRARREATLRLLEQCPDADMVVNLRFETSSISKGQRNSIGSTEVLAYGTAIKFGPSLPG